MSKFCCFLCSVILCTRPSQEFLLVSAHILLPVFSYVSKEYFGIFLRYLLRFFHDDVSWRVNHYSVLPDEYVLI